MPPMIAALLQVLLYSIVAGLSPLAVAATVAVMHAGRARTLAFGIGFVAAQLAVCGLFVSLGVAATRSGTRYPWVQVALAVTLAGVLVWLAGRVRTRPPAAKQVKTNPRTSRMLDRLSHLGLPTTLFAGILLGIGGPKRLLLAGLAATAITTSDLHTTIEFTLVIVYVAISTVVVWGPVILFVLLGDRAVSLIKEGQAEVGRRQPKVTVNALLVLACLCLVDAAGIVVTQIF